jgi:hypothetical protein
VTPARFAAAGWAVTAGMMGAWAAWSAANEPFDGRAVADGTVFTLFLLVMATLGVLITRRVAANPIGWLFCLTPLGVSISVGGSVVVHGTMRGHAAISYETLAGLVVRVGWPTALVSYAILVPLLFPDGRPPGRRWRLVLYADLATVALLAGLLIVQPDRLESRMSNPLGIAAAGSTPVQVALGITVITLIVLGLTSAVARYRSAGAIERLQLRECVLAACTGFAGFVVVSLVDAGDGEILYTICYSLLPVAVGLAMLRYRLYDVDVIIRRTLVFAVLATTLATCYLGGVAILGAALRSVTGQSGTVAVTLSTLATAAAFQPLRTRIQRLVERRFARERYDAERAMAALSARLRDRVELEAIRSDVLSLVDTTLKPRHASLWLRHGEEQS